MSRVIAGLVRRFAALPRAKRLMAGGAAAAVVLAAMAATTFAAAPAPGAQPTALRVDQRANRGEARPTGTTAATPTPAATTPAPAATPAAKATRTAPKATATRKATASGCSGYSGVKLTACNLLPSFGFATGEMAALVPMWERESGWDYTAYNGGSGATGIPQALPGSKMATAGADWRTNPATQIKWGLGYIKSTYGSPSSAWAFWQAHGWY